LTEIKTHANVSPDRSHNGRDKNQKPKQKMNTESKTIKAGQTLTSRSICDYETIYKLRVISRTEKSALIDYNGLTRRTKIHTFEGEEFLRPENFSMCPIFRAA
jgi:hypothetical protein